MNIKRSNFDFVGFCLKHDIINHHGILLLAANTTIGKEHIVLLMNNHIILTEHDFISEQENNLAPQKDTITEKLIEEATLQVKDIFQFVRKRNKIPILEVRNHIIPVIHQASENSDVVQLFSMLQSKDDYTYRHNIGVGVFATLIGKWLHLHESDLKLLTISATLHDVGKMKIPDEILNKPGRLTAAEYDEIKKHTTYGYEMLKKTIGISPTCALVALQHHEREDGSGYPFGLKGDKIHQFSKIVAVADIFHAMTSKRAYHEPAPFYKVINQMQEDRFGKLDPKIIRLFLHKIMMILIGSEVVLSDGRKGEIVMIHTHEPARPLVKIGNEFIDLSKSSSINIEQIALPYA
ncbi:HD-GYP domain-containing protein [Aneurinibacillus uraniidurans]|uniref:HD-GYP domain-containing protein n=1 Tax=Aneurinibacillus uraniidurans TaxID=2966586 RepID=UPI00234AE73B|nr:HD-GYP domain-containing protein [Aneurinibacillus sp. B1]WCN38651.1 HD-GYP domain-containing protein [Aneurinibacillus sp. B1]